jgi:pyruvate kinase
VVIHHDNELRRLVEGDIVVIADASSSLVPYLGKIKAIITEAGGLTSDAAIIGLNYNIPVVVGVQDATRIIGDGMLITVDTPRGAIYRGFAQVK